MRFGSPRIRATRPARTATVVGASVLVVALMLAGLVLAGVVGSGSLVPGSGAVERTTAEEGAGPRTAVSTTRAPRPLRIMPLGDSITHGGKVPGGYRIALWQHLVEAGVPADLVGSQANGPASLGDHDHEGHPGWRIDEIDAHIEAWLRADRPRTVLLHIGTNDISHGYHVATAPRRLTALLDRITTTLPGVRVYVATLIPIAYAQDEVRRFNQQLPGIVREQTAKGRDVVLVDMASALTTADLADGVHPTAEGYALMADTWWAALRRGESLG